MQEQIVDMRDHIPQLSLAERDRRWRAARETMILNGLDCLLVWGSDQRSGMSQANLRYLAYNATDRIGGICVFPLVGKPIALNAEVVPGRLTFPFSNSRVFQNWMEPENIRPYFTMLEVVDLLKELGYEKGTIGLVEPTYRRGRGIITYEDYSTLATELPKAKLVNARGLLEELRMIKSPEEIEFLQRAAKIARLEINSFIAASTIGAKECEVYAKMVETGIASGAEPYIFNFITSGAVNEPYRQHLLHGKMTPFGPTTRELREGDLIMTEFHASYGGYQAGAEKSVFIGKPPQELQRVHDVAVECLRSGTQRMKPDVTLAEVFEAFYKPLQEASMKFLELGFHEHGLTSGGYPTIGGVLRDELMKHAGQWAVEDGGMATMQLRENMVLAVMVDIYDPNWRDDIGIMLGDTVLVTKDGPRNLVDTPLEFTCKE